MTYEVLVTAVCDANESHLEDPFESEIVEVRGMVCGSMFNPKTMRWEEVHSSINVYPNMTLREAKKLLK